MISDAPHCNVITTIVTTDAQICHCNRLAVSAVAVMLRTSVETSKSITAG